MALDKVFQKAASVCFKTFKSMVVIGTYTVLDDNELTEHPVVDPEDPPVVVPDITFQLLFISTSYIDITKLSFYHLMQPEDKIGLIQGVEIPATMKNGGRISVPDGTVYKVEAIDVDPAKALFTVLLRG